MALRPLPDLADDSAMKKLGRMYSLRTAWLDAVHDLRDVVVRLQAGHTDGIAEIAEARIILDRLDEIKKLQT